MNSSEVVTITLVEYDERFEKIGNSVFKSLRGCHLIKIFVSFCSKQCYNIILHNLT